MTIGIYKIECVINNKLYIGSSKNIEKRWYKHKSMLKRNNHHSIHLQRAWNKYGEENFVFQILEECNQSELLDREQYYFNELLKADDYVADKSSFFIKKSYNICPLSIKGFTAKHRRESLLKQVKTRGFEKFHKVDVHGNILDTYDLKSDVEGDNLSCVYKSMKLQQTLKSKDYGFIDSKDYFVGFRPKKFNAWNKDKKFSEVKGTTIYVYDIYGRYYNTFISIHDVARYFNVPVASVFRKLDKANMSLSGTTSLMYYNFFRTEQSNNFLHTFKSEIDELEIYTIFDEFLGYSNKKELVLLLNTTPQAIYGVLVGKRKQIKHYIVKYCNDIV